MSRYTFRLFLIFVAGLSLSVTSGCASTKLNDARTTSAFKGQGFNKILVVAFAYEEIDRVLFEEAAKERLEQKAIKAEIGSKILPNNVLEMEQETLRKLIVDQGFDGVLTMSLSGVSYDDKQAEQRFFGIERAKYVSFDSYYASAHQYVSTTGVYSSDEPVWLQAHLYAPSQGGLVWRGQTKTTHPDPIDEFAEDFAGSLVDRLVVDGLIK